MGVTRQIGKHSFGSAEWPLCVDDPFGVAQRCEISREGLRIGQVDVVAKEAQAAGLVGSDELLQEQPLTLMPPPPTQILSSRPWYAGRIDGTKEVPDAPASGDIRS